MTALELIARLRERGIRIAARDGELELDAPRGALDEELRAELVARKPELLRLLSWSRRSGRELPLVPVTRDSQLPLSWAQQRLWFLDQLEPNSSAYNISWTVRLKGELRVDLLQAAVTQLVQRHESLRTVFPDSNGEPQQLVLPALDINLRQEKLPGVTNEQLRVRLSKIAAVSFDLARGPLLNLTLIQVDEHEHILLVVIHHIVADGASMRVLFRELAAFYESALEGRAAELPDLPVQYADYAVWQRKWLDGEEMQRQTDYWLNVLQGLPPLLELPWDRPRSAAMRYRGASVLRVLPAGLAEELRALGRQQGCTLFMMMLAAFYVLLKRYAGRDDLAVGTPMGGRPRTDLEGLIGFFINTVVLRADLEGDPTFDELLHQVREIALGAHANQELPFEKLVEELHPQRELSYSPVFQVMFDLQEEPRWRLPVNNLEVIPEVVFSSRTSSFDLTLSVRQAESGLDAMFEYDTDLFDESSIEQLATHYQNLLEDIVTNSARPVSRLSLISAVERERIVNAWSSPVEVDLHAPSLQARFAARVMARPGAVALVVGADQYTYAELDDGANKLAQRLLDAGVRSGQVVALLAERSPQSIVGMLGILKAGGCVMPLDPDYPDSRVDFMLRDSQARVLLVSTAQARRAESIAADAERLLLDGDFSAAGQSDSESPLTAGAPDDIAFLLYTSGTTGTPKGVPLLQRGLVNYINQLSRKTGLGAEDRVLQFASLSFDISIEEIFAALLNGATLVLRDQDMNLSADQFLAGCRRFAISWASVPTAWWHELAASMALNRIALPEALRVLVIGGEKARIEAFRQWQKHAGTTRLFNTYGPTETSIAATWCELTHLDAEQGGELPIGSPVPNVSVWVVDEHMQPLPAGVPGELCIGGVGVAGGYWNRPDLSAGRFVADPFSRDEEARLYRTGDRARYRADGRLEFLGRMDAQIKIRGHRIEPGEIESAVAAVAGVEQAVVLPRKAGEEPATELRLVAYFTGSADTAEVQRSLRADLPEYMVPAAFLRMDSLPLTVNGKLDQQRLPAPEWSRDKTQAFVAPRTANEAIVARIWAEVLGLDRIGVHDDFFLSGGHSLLATRVVARLRDAFGAAIPLRDLFEAPTVAGLAETLASADAGSDSAPLTQAHRPSDGLLPLSWAQQRLWMLAQLDSDSSAYNLPWAARLSGAVDTMALQRAVDELVRRHESLRTAFRTHDGEPVQLVANDVRVPVQFDELSGADAAAVRERVQQLAAQRFELHSSPLIRVHLLTTGEQEAVLLIVMHHIVADGWSLGVLFRELAHFYNTAPAPADAGREPPLADLPLQYPDYAIWQRSQLTGAELARLQTYWAARLADLPPLLELPLDRPRPPAQTYRGAWVTKLIAPSLLERLNALAAEQGATLFMLLLTVFKAVLAINCGRDDVVVGTPVAGRNRTQLEGLIGCFLNTLVLRTDLSGNPDFLELLRRVRETTLGAYDHQDLPFEQLLELLQPPRSVAYSPVVQVLFNLQNTDNPALRLDGLDTETFAFDNDTAKFDLSASLQETRAGLRVGFVYNTDLFRRATVADMLAQFETMLERVATTPAIELADLVRTRVPPQIPALPRFTEFPAAALNDSIPGRFAETVARFEERIAVRDSGQAWTYAELDRRSNVIANTILVALGGKYGSGLAKKSVNVGLVAGHDAPMVAALLGVLKAGCAYVPLDPRAPAARLEAIVEQADIELVVASYDVEKARQLARRCAIELIAESQANDETPPTAKPRPDELAYILFTSGSTGVPKGVMQTHRNVLHHVRVYSNSLHIGERDCLSLVSAYGFDAAVMDIFGALLNGAQLLLLDILGAAHPAELVGQVAEHVSIFHATPTVLRYLFDDAAVVSANLHGVRAVVLGGELATPHDFDLFRNNFSDAAVFVNGLGPSESTTALQFFAHGGSQLPGTSVPVGLPVADTVIKVLDGTGKVSGISGELCISSAFVSTGYWRQPELTAQRFEPDVSGPGRTLYRSGDCVRYLPDGQLVYAGRMDRQLKIRGYRVEAAEIESVITSVAGVERCAVLVWRGQSEPAPGVERLVAYAQGAADEQSVRNTVAQALPDYMRPAAYVWLDTLPLLANGKLDQAALPEPVWDGTARGDLRLPGSATEQSLHGLWAELLGLPAISVDADFFAVGGHSLLATRLLARIRDAFSVDLGLRELFAHSSIAALARRIDEQAKTASSVPQLVARISDELPPLSWAQQRLWFLDQLEPDSAAYNLHWAARVAGHVDVQALQAAVNALLKRHAALRTRFAGSDGNPVQLVCADMPVTVQAETMLGASEDRQHARLLELIRRPFDLQSGPLLRVNLLQLAETEYLLLLTMHHIVSDGWSMGILCRELATLYNNALTDTSDAAAASALPELPVQYTDYAIWQRAWLSGGELERQENYWRERLRDAPPLLDLPLDHARPPVQRYRGAWVSETFDVQLLQGLRRLAAEQGATLFMVLLAAFKVLLMRHTGREDILVGTPIAGRRRVELEGLIGFFLNTLVLRSDISGNPSFNEVLWRVKQTTLGAYDHQELPFEKLLELLQPARSTAYTPIVQVMFNLHNEPGGRLALDGAKVWPFPVDRGTAKFDLSVAAVEGSDGLQIGFEYNTDLFERETVAELLNHFRELLEAVAVDPSRLVAALELSATHSQPQPQQHFEPFLASPTETLVSRFEHMVQRYPQRPAVVCATESCSYQELNQRAGAVAAQLAALVPAGSRVGLMLGHDARMIAGLLGVLKAGCAYVPLDPDAPPARVKTIVEEAGLGAVVTDAAHRDNLHAAVNGALAIVDVSASGVFESNAPARTVNPNDTAYILFTSGSTGTPKGVVQSHRNVVHHVSTYTNALHIACEDRLTLFPRYGFDASVMDIFGALLNGACLYPLDLASVDHPGKLLDSMSDQITVFHSTPTVFRFLMRNKVCRHDLSKVRLVVLGGEEALTSDFALFKRHFVPPALFVNGLGPSESTLALQFFADHRTRLPGKVVPVGNPVHATQALLLEPNGAPAGISGELVIRSPFVSMGYWNQPELTAERFIADPAEDQPDHRLYRTGDRVRRLPDGSFAYLGRIDGQLKVRGHRIEPGEIEAQLAVLPGVERVVVALRLDAAGPQSAEPRLVAYLVRDDEPESQRVEAAGLRRQLQAVLPEYMIPQAFVFMEELPLLANGKVNRAALPAPDWTLDQSQNFIEPRTETERQLAGIWIEVLGVKRVGVHDDFFELGGHSLMAAQLVARVTESLQVGLPLRRLFDTPTIAGLAEHVDTLQWALRGPTD